MPANKYIADLLRESETLAKLLHERDEIEIKIARQKKRVAALAGLCDESEFGDGPFDFDLGGLADVCRTAMRASRKEWMTIAEVQAAIKELGYPLEKYKAPAASITTTINRMAEDQEVLVNRRPVPAANEYKYIGLGHKAAKELLNLIRIGSEIVSGIRVTQKVIPNAAEGDGTSLLKK